MGERKITLPTAVTDAIRDMLPGQIGATLRLELEKGAQAIEDLAHANEEIEKLARDNKEHGSLNSRRKRATERQEKLDAKSRELQQREHDLDLRELEVRLECEQRYSIRMEATLAGLVRNTEWREQVHNWEFGYYSSDGAPAMPAAKDKSVEAK